MTFDEYRMFYLNDINNSALSEQTYPIEIFIERVGEVVKNDFNMLTNDIVNCAYETKTGNKNFKKMRIDAYCVDTISNTINLFIADYNDGNIQYLSNEIINAYTNLMLNFFENVLKGFFADTEPSATSTQAAYEILENLSSINKLHLYILSTNKISNRIKNLNLEPFIFQNKTYNIKLDVVDFDRIYKNVAETFEKEDLIIETKKYGFEGINCIKADLKTNEYDSYLAVVPGKFLADIYDDYSSQLLESNVRSFLSFRGAINKGIRGTILNQQSKFFTYNNGISAIANEVETKFVENKGLVISKFIGLQIINGGQTTASLASTRIKDKVSLDNIFVQMKLTIVKENNPEFIRSIAKYANSQNKVTSADLNSNHPFYIRIEDFSRKIYAPTVNGHAYQELWFFERARGQYEQPMIKMTTQKQREEYQRIRPKDKKFTKTDLAKYVNSANMFPYYVSWGADVNSTKFQEWLEKIWEKDNSVFNEYFYKELIGMAILYKSLEKIISNQQWYIENRAYRPQLVTYTFSKFVYEVKQRNYIIDYKSFWDRQGIPLNLEGELAKIAKLAFDNMYNNREISNISTYCKNKICWDRLRDARFELNRDGLECLISSEDKETKMHTAKKEQKYDSNLILSLELFKKGTSYRENLLQKGIEQKLLDYTQVNVMQILIDCIKKGKLISVNQAEQVCKIIKIFEENGLS